MSIFNTTYPDPKVTKAINSLVGTPYSLCERLKMNGVGSRRMIVENKSDNFNPYLLADHYLTYANIELRRNGIIIHIHKKLENYAWVLPFDRFELSRKDKNLIIEINKEFLEFRDVYKFNEKFLERIKKKLLVKSQSFSGS